MIATEREGGEEEQALEDAMTNAYLTVDVSTPMSELAKVVIANLQEAGYVLMEGPRELWWRCGGVGW